MRTDVATPDYNAVMAWALHAGAVGPDWVRGPAGVPAGAEEARARRAFWRTDEAVSYLPPHDPDRAPSASDAEPSARTRALMALQRELEGYTRLTPDWDGYGGQPAMPAMLADALTFLAQLPALAAVPKPMLTGGGAIGLYWEQERATGGGYASLEFDGIGHYTYLTESPPEAGGDGGEEDVPVSRCAPGLARWLLAE